MGMPCLNCKKEVADNQGKFLLGVFLCPRCFEAIELLWNRGRCELENLIASLTHCFRLSVSEGKLRDVVYRGAEGVKLLSQEQLLKCFVDSYLDVLVYGTPPEETPCLCIHRTPSSENILPNVVEKAAEEPSDSVPRKAAD